MTEFLDGSMGEPTELRCLVHLAGCEGCDTYLDHRQTVVAVGALSGPNLPSAARDQLLGAFRCLPRT
ncbi:hypothetical protein ACWCXB_29090 [Streptomyces sp. NPDC001514]